MKTVCFTSDAHMWLLQGFLHQWSKYGAGEGLIDLEIAGFTKPEQDLAFPFVSIGDFKDYPLNKWSDAVINRLERIEDDLVLILLEDYWLMRPVNLHAVVGAAHFMTEHPDVLRFDLTTDRVFSYESRYAGYSSGLDLCQAGGQYSLSFQASIYRRKLLLEVLVPGESPWESELNGSARVNAGGYSVLGSYQWPICYMIVMNKGRFDREGQWMYPARSLSLKDWQELDALGYTSPERGLQREHAL